MIKYAIYVCMLLPVFAPPLFSLGNSETETITDSLFGIEFPSEITTIDEVVQNIVKDIQLNGSLTTVGNSPFTEIALKLTKDNKDYFIVFNDESLLRIIDLLPLYSAVLQINGAVICIEPKYLIDGRLSAFRYTILSFEDYEL